MCINLRLVRLALVVERPISARYTRAVVLNDVTDSRARVRLNDDEVGVYVHLDDFGIMAKSHAIAEEATGLIAGRLQGAGFDVTRRIIGEGERFIGLTVRESPARWEPTPQRLGDLDRFLEYLLAAPTVLPRVLHTAIAIYVWLSLFRREAMCIPHAAYRYLEQVNHRRPLWRSVREELRVMRGSLALIYADLALVGLPYVLAQDAAVERTCTGELRHGAFCLAAATPPPAEVVDCLHRFQLVGRGRELAVGLGGTPWEC
jgi:hypothetical protein